MVDNLVPPHGGKLVERLIDLNDRDVILSEARELPRLCLSSKEVSDLIMLAIGAFSPLEGFLNREDYNCVISEMRLTNGLLWPIPITMEVLTNIKVREHLKKIGDD